MFNKTVSKKSNNNFVLNEENYKVYKRPVDLDLFLHSCGFTPRNSFYHSETEKLNFLVDLIGKNNKEFVYALTWYIGSKIGLRLAPTIITTELALKANSEDDWKKISKIVKDIFTRPDFLTNACGYIKYKYNLKSFMEKMPIEYKNLLKKQLESFNDLTLKRQKLKRKEIKLADLIKTLRPKPKDEYYSKLYKAIIENDNFASLKVEINEESGQIQKAEHITTVISSDKISLEDKVKYIRENIKTIPINALIKNLTYLEAEDSKALKDRLTNILSDSNGFRFINPYDLIILRGSRNKYSATELSTEIVATLDDVLIKFVAPKFENVKKPIILYDRSGSMFNEPHYIGSKFVAMLYNLFKKDFRFYTFNEHVSDITEPIKEISKIPSLNYFTGEFHSNVHPSGGTALLESMEYTIQKNTDLDLLIIVTDEVTWADSKHISGYRRVIPPNLYGRVILFNASPGVGTVLKPGLEITRIAGLNNSNLSIIKVLSNFDEFKSKIIEEFNSSFK